MGQQARAGELRAAIDRLPLSTRRAMLKGIQEDSIIVGADGNPRGGVCPLYATSAPPSRRVGRPFARAWDRFAGARLPRPASERELRTLRSMLETSIELETEPAAPAVSLREAIAAHKVSQARTRAVSSLPERRPADEQSTPAPARRAPARDTGEQDRTRELARHDGWAWLRPFRRLDDYERALQALDALAQAASAASESESEQLVSSSAGRN